ncbi:hypothetical protein RvY_01746-2 [Ramazzottius varieornatus]|uniref:BHLH domain-containing protein n=1 Tax=Ramazzottius varieornatus TaxID=947166 RepID=A0A1D1UL86_RAMVA|nr:hypothetical protein RvY_01746-2 [Ramazzottius varieornatus]
MPRRQKAVTQEEEETPAEEMEPEGEEYSGEVDEATSSPEEESPMSGEGDGSYSLSQSTSSYPQEAMSGARRRSKSAGGRGTGGGRKGSQASQQQQMVHAESPDGSQPIDKKQRREIANNNERRRMQCINNGFSTLQGILPRHFTKRGEKMSKAAVLQCTVEYIQKLEAENIKLKRTNTSLLHKINGTVPTEEETAVPEVVVKPEEDVEEMESKEESPQPAGTVQLDVHQLVNLTEHWRRKCQHERAVRTEIEQKLRGVLSDMQSCPAQTCNLRSQDYLASLPASSPSEAADPDPNYDSIIALPQHTHNATVFTLETSQGEKRKNPLRCPCGSPACNVLVCYQANQTSKKGKGGRKPRNTKRSRAEATKAFSSPVKGERETDMHGFQILMEAINHTQQECNRSDSGCSEETFESTEPPKKRSKAAVIPEEENESSPSQETPEEDDEEGSSA